MHPIERKAASQETRLFPRSLLSLSTPPSNDETSRSSNTPRPEFVLRRVLKAGETRYFETKTRRDERERERKPNGEMRDETRRCPYGSYCRSQKKREKRTKTSLEGLGRDVSESVHVLREENEKGKSQRRVTGERRCFERDSPKSSKQSKESDLRIPKEWRCARRSSAWLSTGEFEGSWATCTRFRLGEYCRRRVQSC